MAREQEPSTIQYWLMLTEIYIQALLVDEELADQVWDKGEIDDQVAWLAWWLITLAPVVAARIPK